MPACSEACPAAQSICGFDSVGSSSWSWLLSCVGRRSNVQRKVLTPNDFPCLEAVAERLANFERYFESIAHPFEWKFTRADLNALIARMRNRWAQSQSLKMAA
jgi:hypothetical protein